MTKEEILGKMSKAECIEVIKDLFDIYDMNTIDINELKEKGCDFEFLDVNDKYWENNFGEIISYVDDEDLFENFYDKLTYNDLP